MNSIEEILETLVMSNEEKNKWIRLFNTLNNEGKAEILSLLTKQSEEKKA